MCEDFDAGAYYDEINALKKQNEALLHLVEAYREYDNYPDDHRECRVHSNKLDNCLICEAEQEYERTMKDNG